MIHFVYAVPSSSNSIRRLLDRYHSRIFIQMRRRFPFLNSVGRNFSIQSIRRSPYSITVNLYRYLSERTPTKLYDLREPGGLRYRADDIILGHPWMKRNTIIEDAVLNPMPCQLKALIFPIHHAMPEINQYAQPLVEKVDLIFGIMGRYWYETIGESAFASWKKKIIRLDMAVDEKLFPRVKQNFNPPGQRGYLYIGRNSPEKGPNVLSQTMGGLQDFRRSWIGNGNPIPNMNRLSIGEDFHPSYINQLAKDYDFFVNTSVSDANPTTILEAMAWGFPVACTPETGYYNDPNIFSLSTTNIDNNIKLLRELQYMPEEHLLRIADQNREQVEKHFTWENFCGRIWHTLENFLVN